MPLHAFGVLNFSERKAPGGVPGFRRRGFAVKMAVEPMMPLGGRLAEASGPLFNGESDPSTGNSREFRTVAESFRNNFGAPGNWSYLQITIPTAPGDVNDPGVSLQNRGLGLFTVQAAFDYSPGTRLRANLAAGWLNAAVRNPQSGSRETATEQVNTFTHDFGGGLEAEVGATDHWRGDFCEPSPMATRPVLLWEAFSHVPLEL